MSKSESETRLPSELGRGPESILCEILHEYKLVRKPNESGREPTSRLWLNFNSESMARPLIDSEIVPPSMFDENLMYSSDAMLHNPSGMTPDRRLKSRANTFRVKYRLKF